MRSLALLAVMMFPLTAFTADEESNNNEVYGSWVKVCQPAEDAQAEGCQITQIANQQESGKRVFQTTVGFVQDREEPVLFLNAPLGIYLPKGISISVDEAEPVTARVQRCDQNGCLGLLALGTELAGQLKGGEKAQVIFAATNEQLIQLPLDLNGFTDALAALEGSQGT